MKDQTWAEITKDIVDRLELCAKLDMDLVEHPKGCAAMAALIKDMARIIDEEIRQRRAGQSGNSNGSPRSTGPCRSR